MTIKNIHMLNFLLKLRVQIINKFSIGLIKCQAKKYNIQLLIGDNVMLRHCRLYAINGSTNNKLHIANNANLCGVRFAFFKSNGSICIGGG